jgi:hypothetical protein
MRESNNCGNNVPKTAQAPGEAGSPESTKPTINSSNGSIGLSRPSGMPCLAEGLTHVGHTPIMKLPSSGRLPKNSLLSYRRRGTALC